MSTYSGTIANRLLTFVLILGLWGPQAWSAPCRDLAAPPDAAQQADRRKGLAFTYTPEYRREFKEAIDSARKACRRHSEKGKVAVVADIDETLLDNREEIRRHPDFDWPQFFAWMGEAKAPVLEPTAGFLAWARKRGFAIFLVTGRQENLRRATIINLVRQNVAYDGLLMRPNGDERPAEQVKVPHREAIEKMGFTIVVNIGDQWSDLSGGHAENCVKLPNKMYFVR
ncbi:MAG TPA: HAD family acid phosphatase [Candidatus Obscuribacterales bacterium]